MPISATRVLALQRRKQRLTQNFYKTVHLEFVTVTAGPSDYRSSTDQPTLNFSYLLDPRPGVHIASETDIAEGGQNVSLQDLVFEIIGDQLTEADLRMANRVVLNKGKSDEEHMSIQQLRPGDWIESGSRERTIAVVGGQVIKWKLFCRSTKIAA